MAIDTAVSDISAAPVRGSFVPPAGAGSQTWTPRPRPRRVLRVPPIVIKAVLPVIAVLLWQAGSSWGWWPAAVLPSPVSVARTFGTLTSNGKLPHALLASLKRVVIGGSIGVVAGVAFGVACGLWRRAEQAVDPTLQMLRTLPFLVLLPLFIVWFGIGELPKMIIIAMGTMFPMYLNTFSGIRNVDSRLVEMARTYQLSRSQLIRKVVLPGALPSVLTGLRYAMGVSWLALVVAEQINPRNGLGYLIYNAQEFFEANILLVVIVVYAALGLGTDTAVRLLERWLLRWQRGFIGR
jgi:sulfonate transport system permease protein